MDGNFLSNLMDPASPLGGDGTSTQLLQQILDAITDGFSGAPVGSQAQLGVSTLEGLDARTSLSENKDATKALTAQMRELIGAMTESTRITQQRERPDLEISPYSDPRTALHSELMRGMYGPRDGESKGAQGFYDLFIKGPNTQFTHGLDVDQMTELTQMMVLNNFQHDGVRMADRGKRVDIIQEGKDTFYEMETDDGMQRIGKEEYDMIVQDNRNLAEHKAAYVSSMADAMSAGWGALGTRDVGEIMQVAQNLGMGGAGAWGGMHQTDPEVLKNRFGDIMSMGYRYGRPNEQIVEGLLKSQAALSRGTGVNIDPYTGSRPTGDLFNLALQTEELVQSITRSQDRSDPGFIDRTRSFAAGFTAVVQTSTAGQELAVVDYLANKGMISGEEYTKYKDLLREGGPTAAGEYYRQDIGRNISAEQFGILHQLSAQDGGRTAEQRAEGTKLLFQTASDEWFTGTQKGFAATARHTAATALHGVTGEYSAYLGEEEGKAQLDAMVAVISESAGTPAEKATAQDQLISYYNRGGIGAVTEGLSTTANKLLAGMQDQLGAAMGVGSAQAHVAKLTGLVGDVDALEAHGMLAGLTEAHVDVNNDVRDMIAQGNYTGATEAMQDIAGGLTDAQREDVTSRKDRWEELRRKDLVSAQGRIALVKTLGAAQTTEDRMALLAVAATPQEQLSESEKKLLADAGLGQIASADILTHAAAFAGDAFGTTSVANMRVAAMLHRAGQEGVDPTTREALFADAKKLIDASPYGVLGFTPSPEMQGHIEDSINALGSAVITQAVKWEDAVDRGKQIKTLLDEDTEYGMLLRAAGTGESAAGPRDKMFGIIAGEATGISKAFEAAREDHTGLLSGRKTRRAFSNLQSKLLDSGLLTEAQQSAVSDATSVEDLNKLEQQVLTAGIGAARALSTKDSFGLAMDAAITPGGALGGNIDATADAVIKLGDNITTGIKGAFEGLVLHVNLDGTLKDSDGAVSHTLTGGGEGKMNSGSN